MRPHPGGTTTFYRHFADGLQQRGWQVFSVALGRSDAELFEAPFGDDGSVLVGSEAGDVLSQARAFLQWLEQENVDIIIPNNYEAVITALPHLPPRVRYVSLCHTTVRMAYVLCTRHADRLSCLVVVNRLQEETLRKRWEIPPEMIRLIPSGIDCRRFQATSRRTGSNGPLRLAFLGRLDDLSKGVLWLPEILGKLKAWNIPFSFHLAGSGPDRERLLAVMASRGLGAALIDRGQLLPGDIPDFLAGADVFLMPSRYEGLPFSLLEAMAAGCVPVATHLRGVTDMVIQEGRQGFLCPMGKVEAFAERIAFLSRNPEVRRRLSASARKRVAEAFSLERMAAEYDSLFMEILAAPPVPYQPRPLEQMCPPRELLPTWRTRLPNPLKKFVRTWSYRLF